MADDYRSKLKQFFDRVPMSVPASITNSRDGYSLHGIVEAGRPPFPFTGPGVKEAIEHAIANNAISNNPTFTMLTGCTHTELLTNWKGGGKMTSCNGFVLKAGQLLGIPFSLGHFYVEEWMTKNDKRHCWISASSGEKPQFGDFFETRRPRKPTEDSEHLHIGFSLSVDGDDWHTIEAGYGGPASGCDLVARVQKNFSTSYVLGWVDMRLLTSGQPPLPAWLLGTWMIDAEDHSYIYSFNRYGEVTQKAYKPAPGEENVPNLDTGKVYQILGESVTVQWDRPDRHGDLETFFYDRENSVPIYIERMFGYAADNSFMKGVRLSFGNLYFGGGQSGQDAAGRRQWVAK